MCEVTTFYDLALENFSLKEKDIIEKILDLWSKQSNNGYRIKLNLFLEHFLAPELISKILQNIIINSDYLGEDNNTKLLEDGYQEICRQNLLQGGEISGERPIIVGTVINKSKFIGELKKQDKDGTIFLNDPQEIENFVEALLKPDSNFFQIFITQERRSLNESSNILEQVHREEQVLVTTEDEGSVSNYMLFLMTQLRLIRMDGSEKQGSRINLPVGFAGIGCKLCFRANRMGMSRRFPPSRRA